MAGATAVSPVTVSGSPVTTSNWSAPCTSSTAFSATDCSGAPTQVAPTRRDYRGAWFAGAGTTCACDHVGLAYPCYNVLVSSQPEEGRNLKGPLHEPEKLQADREAFASQEAGAL